MLAVCLLILEGEIYSLVLSWSDRFGRENIMKWLPQMKPLCSCLGIKATASWLRGILVATWPLIQVGSSMPV